MKYANCLRILSTCNIRYSNFNNFCRYSINNICRPEKTDFVRMAGLLEAIIVPFSAVGISDSVTILLDQTGMYHAVQCISCLLFIFGCLYNKLYHRKQHYNTN